MRKRLIIPTLVLGLLAFSGIALAADEDKDDSVFNFGYDEESQVLVWNLSPDDGLFDCTLENGPLTATYGVSVDGLVFVDGLTNGSDAVSFPARPQDELAEGLVAAAGPVDYTGADGECGLSAGSVPGPNGQVNHGMFMKLFNSLWTGQGRGCVVRHLAQSDFGKGDQQIRVPDVDPDAPEVSEGATGTIEFNTELADCVHGNDDEISGQANAAEKRAEQAERKDEREAERAEKKAEKAAERAERGRGNSGSAPGNSGSGPGQGNQ